MNSRSPFWKFRYHILLIIGRLNHNRFKFCLRNRKMKLVRSFNIRHFLEHIHEFWKIEKFCKPGSCTIARSLWSQLDSSGRFAKGRCPAVKMGQILLLKRVILKVSHNRIKFRHRVRYGSTCCKNYTTPTSQFIHITTFHKHIWRFLCFWSGQSCHIPHFCV